MPSRFGTCLFLLSEIFFMQKRKDRERFVLERPVISRVVGQVPDFFTNMSFPDRQSVKMDPVPGQVLEFHNPFFSR